MNFFKVKTTHIAEVREQQANQMDEVCALLEWSRDKYCRHQFSEYEKFCQLLAGFDPELKRRLRYSPVFRGFWNNEWASRNATDFLPFATECENGPAWILEEYLFINSAARLIMCNAFARRFEKILKSI